MMKFFMWAAYNAYVLKGYHNPHAQASKRATTFHVFLEQLYHELVGHFRTTARQGCRRLHVDPDICLSDVGRHEVESADHQQIVALFVANAKTNNRTVCSEKYRRAKLANPTLSNKDLPKRSKAVYWCNYCCVFLCIGKPR